MQNIEFRVGLRRPPALTGSPEKKLIKQILELLAMPRYDCLFKQYFTRCRGC